MPEKMADRCARCWAAVQTRVCLAGRPKKREYSGQFRSIWVITV